LPAPKAELISRLAAVKVLFFEIREKLPGAAESWSLKFCWPFLCTREVSLTGSPKNREPIDIIIIVVVVVALCFLGTGGGNPLITISHSGRHRGSGLSKLLQISAPAGPKHELVGTQLMEINVHKKKGKKKTHTHTHVYTSDTHTQQQRRCDNLELKKKGYNMTCSTTGRD
jgi:hypothetical protein